MLCTPQTKLHSPLVCWAGNKLRQKTSSSKPNSSNTHVIRHCLAIKSHKLETLRSSSVSYFLGAAIWTVSQHVAKKKPNKQTKKSPNLWTSWFLQQLLSSSVLQSSFSLSLRDTEGTPSVLPCMWTASWWAESAPAASTAMLLDFSRARRAASGWLGWLVGYPVTGQIPPYGRRTEYQRQKIRN